MVENGGERVQFKFVQSLDPGGLQSGGHEDDSSEILFQSLLRDTIVNNSGRDGDVHFLSLFFTYVAHPAFSLPTAASPPLQGALKVHKTTIQQKTKKANTTVEQHDTQTSKLTPFNGTRKDHVWFVFLGSKRPFTNNEERIILHENIKKGGNEMNDSHRTGRWQPALFQNSLSGNQPTDLPTKPNQSQPNKPTKLQVQRCELKTVRLYDIKRKTQRQN